MNKKITELLKQKARFLKNESYALAFAYRDKRTPYYAKVLIVFTLGYLLSPIDLIPDFIPILGYLDDLIIVPALIALSIKLIPYEVMTECRDKAKLNIEHQKKTAWWFAIIVILLWLTVLLLISNWILKES